MCVYIYNIYIYIYTYLHLLFSYLVTLIIKMPNANYFQQRFIQLKVRKETKFVGTQSSMSLMLQSSVY